MTGRLLRRRELWGTVTPALKPLDAAKIKSRSNQANNRQAQPAQTTGGTPSPEPLDAAKIKSHSNQRNNREAQLGTGTTGRSGHK